MAEKESTLAIVIRAVDKTTAGINAFAARIKSLGVLVAPIELIGERIGALGKAAGIPKVASAIGGVGSAASKVFGNIKGALLGAGLSAGLVVHQLSSLVEEFDGLGDKSERLGVGADFLASMRFAAERAGAEVEELDSGLESFFKNLGAARAGKGPIVKFLSVVSPALLSQLKAAKSNEKAFDLMANAMAKVVDPAKRLALAEKVGLGGALAPLLAKGAAGVGELREEFMKLAGSQEDAAAGAGAVDDAMKDLKAATQGIKAALISGLAPALRIVVDQLREWFVAHREDVKLWAKQIGQQLPGAIASIVSSLRDALGFVRKFVDMIGGWKVAVLGLAAAFSGPLISAVVSLGVAMLSTPFGAILAGLGATAAAVAMLVGEIQKLQDALDISHELLLQDVDAMNSGKMTPAEFDARHPGFRAQAAREPNFLINPSVVASVPRSPLQQMMDRAPAPLMQQKVDLNVRFENAPRGMRVTADPKSTVDVDLTVGSQMLGMPP